MSTIFLTSNLELYYKDDNGTRIAKVIDNTNNILDNLKRCIKKYDNILYIASVEDNPIATDIYGKVSCEGIKLTFGFKKYDILDGRNASDAKRLIKEADLIILGGGHLPSQNKFFNNIYLREKIRDTDAVICGISAGSMNCADIVYCPPELDGEALDSDFQRQLKGLGLTKINILPHFSSCQDLVVDDKNYIEEIIIPDSYQTKLLVLNDGSYVLKKADVVKVYGLAYVLYKGKFTKVCGNGEVVEIDENSFEVKL